MRLNHSEILNESRVLLGLAWPVMLTSLNWTLLHLIDVAIVGHVSTHELGALAAGRALTYVSIVVGIATLSGVLVFTSRADGAGDRARCGGVFREGILLALFMGLMCMAVLQIWAEPLVHMVGVAPELVADGARVVRAMSLGYVPQFLLCTLTYTLEGLSRPQRPMVVNLAMLPVNAVLAWAWAGGHWGFPAEGAAGAALATALTSVFGAVAMLVSVWTLPDAQVNHIRDVSLRAWMAAFRGIRRLIGFGLVPALASGLELVGFSWLIALSTQLGAVPAAAFQMVFSLHNFAFGFALGIASAAGVRVGNAVGASTPELVRPRSLIAAALAVGGMGIISMIYISFAGAVLRPFSNDEEALLLAAAMLVLWAPFIVFDGVQMVFVYALRSMGDQVAAGLNGVVAFFFVTGGLGWLFIRSMQMGPMGLVFASAAGMIVAALLQGARLGIVTGRLRLQNSA